MNTKKKIIMQTFKPNANKWLNCTRCNFFPFSPPCPSQFPVPNTLTTFLSAVKTVSSLRSLQASPNQRGSPH